MKISLVYDKIINSVEVWTWKDYCPEYLGRLKKDKIPSVLTSRQFEKYKNSYDNNFNVKLSKLETALQMRIG